MGLLARVRRRIRRTRGRLRDLRQAYVLRHARSLYWNARVKHARASGVTPERLATIRTKRDASRRLGQDIKAAQRKLRHLRRQLRRQEKHLVERSDTDGDGLIWIDGKQVSEAVGQEILRIRDAGRWHGVVVSGYRTPEYSERLCYQMCGAPKCPGRCAGRDTNHAHKGGRNGAGDLSDYLTFRSECWRLGSWLENHLPRDLVHFSDSGY